jgi:hypothetical protein
VIGRRGTDPLGQGRPYDSGVVTQPGPADDDGSLPAPPAPSQSWRRPGLLIALALGLCGLAIAAAGFASQALPRRFSAAQQRQIEAWELARRWRELPEGAIFPATVSYRLPGYALDGSQGLSLPAHRLGVVPAVSCTRGTGLAAARVLRRYGCTAVLRATYADSTGSLVATVGVAVLAGSAGATAAGRQLVGSGPGSELGTVRPAPVSGTLAARFGDAQRQLSGGTHAGPYVIMATVGYADGRPQVRVAADSYLSAEMTALQTGLTEAVADVLGKPPHPAACPGTPGC